MELVSDSSPPRRARWLSACAQGCEGNEWNNAARLPGAQCPLRRSAL